MKTWLSVYTWSSLILDYKNINCYTLSSQNIFCLSLGQLERIIVITCFLRASHSENDVMCALSGKREQEKAAPTQILLDLFRVPYLFWALFVVSLVLDLKYLAHALLNVTPFANFVSLLLCWPVTVIFCWCANNIISLFASRGVIPGVATCSIEISLGTPFENTQYYLQHVCLYKLGRVSCA